MKKLYIFLISVVVISLISFIAIDNMGYESIKVNGGTIYGKLEGNNKDVVVLIIAGSGPTDMNGNTPLIKGRNDSFIQMAKDLKKEGISTFRYDKRTAGKSGETFNIDNMDFDYFVDDAAESIRHLKSLGYKKVVVLGHSQGSLVGMLASLKEDVDGYISLAGGGAPIDVILEKQILPQVGEDSEEIGVIKSLREGKIDTSFNDDHQFSVTNQEFLLTWMKYNPKETIGQLDIPTLIVQGSNDVQVFIEDYEALKEGNSNAKYKLLDGMNHVLKRVKDDKENVDSYTDPSYPLHDELIPTIVKFINDEIKK